MHEKKYSAEDVINILNAGVVRFLINQKNDLGYAEIEAITSLYFETKGIVCEKEEKERKELNGSKN